ncbi:MOSC domain-containing protein [Aestuariibacter sp. AA17]|uniref:MOSC domain-containing protein n=1 Tax=Fluctibacter corallii TaxID=2984329 RepID=A0ABT3AD67_9ALTE|nr:MOSC domain-containing protein [Aestuariibacter sp. AA17]MCV2886617.1 MOSC domain-containing protein [Aestuariibacter sp. AA17]
MHITGLFAGSLRPLGPQGKKSGIYKSPIQEAQVNELGMTNDIQADKRFHGGPEKALHQYALSGYEALMKRYPLFHKRFCPGAIGENISSTDMRDDNVFIGDIYQLGDIKVQVSSPRKPCWKIGAKLEVPDIEAFIEEKGITGWYYRVLENGTMRIGDTITLIERPNPSLSVKRFVTLMNGVDASIDNLRQALEAGGLDPEWKSRIQRRISSKQESENDFQQI